MPNNLPPNLPRLKAGWSWVKLGDVCEIVMGQSPPSTTYNTSDIGLPFFQGKAEFTELYPEVRKWCSEPNKIAEPLDILVSVRAPVGSSNIANKKCCIGRGLAALRYSDCNKYIFYYIRLSETELDKLGTGSTFKAISSTTLRNFEIPLPPLPEQKKIVEKIEELFSALDSGVASLKKAKEQIRLYRQSVLASAFSGRLYPQQSRGRQDSSDDKINRIEEKNKSDKFLNPENPQILVNHGSDNLPVGWKWVKLGEVITFLGSGVTPRGGRNVYKTQGIKFIRSQNVYPNRLVLEDIVYITNDIDEKMERSRVKPLDVLLNITGASIGRAANIPESFGQANVNQHVCILRTNQNEVRSKYLSLYLNSNFAQQHINRIQIGATRQALNYSQIKMFPFPLCPVNQQTQIVEEIEKRFSEADNLEKAIDESLAKSETLRQSILKQAFEGRLV